MKRLAAAAFLLAMLVLLPVKAYADGGEVLVENAVQDSAGEFCLLIDAMPGEILLCRSTIVLSGAFPGVLHGTLDSGVSLERILSISCNGKEINASFYTLTTNRLSDGCSFEIHLADGFSDKEVNCCLEVVYTVMLNPECLVESPNYTEVFWRGEETERHGERAGIITRSVSLYKGLRWMAEERTTPLEGVSYMLTKGDTRLVMAEKEAGVYIICPGHNCTHTRHSAVVRTPVSGILRVEGLSEGVYSLKETKTPSGVDPTEEPIVLRVESNGGVSAEGIPEESGILVLLSNVEATEKAKEQDPLNIYRWGCILLVGGGVLLFRRYGIPVGFISFPSAGKARRRGSRKIPLR